MFLETYKNICQFICFHLKSIDGNDSYCYTWDEKLVKLKLYETD